MSVSSTRRALLGAGAAASLGSFALPSRAAARPEVVRFGVSTAGVGDPPRVAAGWLSVAQSKGYVEQALKQDNIRVEWTFFKGQGPAVNEALSNDQLDFTTLGDLPSIVGRSVGIKTRLVLVTNARSSAYVAVRPDSDVRSIQALRGKRVAFHKGTATQLVANRIFEQNGLTERDFKVINLEPASTMAAFASGDVDGIIGSLSLATLQEKGLARVIYDTRQNAKATSGGHILVREAFGNEHPALTQKVVTALVRAAHWASLDTNRTEVIRLWASAGSISTATYEAEFRGVPLSHRLSPQFDPFVVASDRLAVEDAFRYKLIRRKFDVDGWIDRRYADQALKDLQLERFWPRFDPAGALLST
jgi:sulfonate transport system substrate-binding protein